MKITVITVYDNIPMAQVKKWADHTFNMSWANKLFPPEQLKDMKADFMKGEDVVAQSKDPADSGMTVTTKWKLEL